MRIAFLGNFQVDYCSEVHHAKSLEALGHTVFRLQEGKKDGSQILSVAKTCDVFVWVHTHGWKTPGLKMSMVLQQLRIRGIPTLSYHLDLWMGLKRQADIKHDDVWQVQHWFTVDKLMADYLNQNTKVKGHYIPAGVFGDECYVGIPEMVHGDKWQVPKENEIIFVGAKNYHHEWQYRPQLIEWLQSNYKDKFKLYGGDGLGVVRGHALNELYTKTKIVIGDTLCINYNYPYYYSDRLFETLGRGGFLIFPYIKGIEDLFEDKKHLVLYEFGNFGQLRELINYYLEHDEERENIRLAGHELVKSRDTYRHRWEKILSEL